MRRRGVYRTPYCRLSGRVNCTLRHVHDFGRKPPRRPLARNRGRPTAIKRQRGSRMSFGGAVMKSVLGALYRGYKHTRKAERGRYILEGRWSVRLLGARVRFYSHFSGLQSASTPVSSGSNARGWRYKKEVGLHSFIVFFSVIMVRLRSDEPWFPVFMEKLEEEIDSQWESEQKYYPDDWREGRCDSQRLDALREFHCEDWSAVKG